MMGEQKQGRGRPRGRTQRGQKSRAHLFTVATRLIAERGFEGTTMRLIAQEAGTSPGLLYRYFPNKNALVLELYERLSEGFLKQATALPAGKWAARSVSALRASLGVLKGHRQTLAALVPLLVGDPERGIFGRETALARSRVQSVFEVAVNDADNRPPDLVAVALARVLYVLHLCVILWWLLDRSPGQRATQGLLALVEAGAPRLAPALRLGPVRRALVALDGLILDGIFGEPSEDLLDGGDAES